MSHLTPDEIMKIATLLPEIEFTAKTDLAALASWVGEMDFRLLEQRHVQAAVAYEALSQTLAERAGRAFAEFRDAEADLLRKLAVDMEAEGKKHRREQHALRKLHGREPR